MLLLQFSTSHYCRKARLALGFKKIPYQVKNLTPGLHVLKLRPLTGLTKVPVLLPQKVGEPRAIADSTRIFQYLETYQNYPPLMLPNVNEQNQALLLEDWLDESIGTATRFIYYHFRAGEGKSIDPSLFSQMVINIVRNQYNIIPATVKLASERLKNAMNVLSYWQYQPYLVGNCLSVADLTASALLSPLGLIPEYRQNYPWLFEKIIIIHEICGEKLPAGLN
ncbi:MAG: glutathione S-transferase family protein [cyanobacterium endosymbiont of Rhopalodia musculus]|uniref:glutathione S-transferase family protein n=1 Tax=cyanobacterium endosymbiont of Epithemia clementina EcSB TaxID=3034674 RepID=UPI002480A9B3|nr:glutathione S-transferase family protein [cyanobacterium endosymbiont of Epithemia clementina EcSB]WGT67249.1 glutathione S-transferase family protein [cyanobacterium endosymbiont of Epithemia clementina EcSB]